MLYEIREAQRAILNPVSGWADAMSKLFSNPYSPFSYTPMATRVARSTKSPASASRR